jgi:hypothetical protein
MDSSVANRRAIAYRKQSISVTRRGLGDPKTRNRPFVEYALRYDGGARVVFVLHRRENSLASRRTEEVAQLGREELEVGALLPAGCNPARDEAVYC